MQQSIVFGIIMTYTYFMYLSHLYRYYMLCWYIAYCHPHTIITQCKLQVVIHLCTSVNVVDTQEEHHQRNLQKVMNMQHMIV